MSGFSVCLIGNSHVAAIKEAWTNRAPQVAPGFSLTFFSAQTRLMRQIEVEGRVLAPQSDDLSRKLAFTSGGPDRIAVDDYDAFVLLGSGFGINVPRLQESWNTVDALPWGEPGTLISRACFEAMVEDEMRQTILIDLFTKIRSVRDVPIVIAGAPFFSERVLETAPYNEDSRLRDAGFLAPLVDHAVAAADRVAAAHGCDVIWQAEETIGLPGFTKLEFGNAPVRFKMRGGGTPKVDVKHGNEDYGQIMLLKYLQRLDEMSRGRAFRKAEPLPRARRARG